MSFMPEIITPETLAGMATNLSQSLESKGLDGRQATTLLAGTLGFSSWEEALFDCEANHWIIGWSEGAHPGMEWLSKRDNRFLFYRVLSMQMEMGVAMYDAYEQMGALLPQAGAPPQIQDLLLMMRYRMRRDNTAREPLAELVSRFSGEEAMAIDLNGRLSSFQDVIRRLSQGNFLS